jgi:prepilin-type processing-associated H-X9-DG protein
MCERPASIRRRCFRRAAFTLVELLAVIGIIVVLLAMLVGAVAGVRSRGIALTCQSNLRTLAQGVTLYATEFRGKYPPHDAFAGLWHDEWRVGGLLAPGGLRKGGVFSCPADEGARLSYGINAWMCSRVGTYITDATPPLGAPWGSRCPNSSQVILLAETWSGSDNASVGYAPNSALVGYRGRSPGRRFGAAGGSLFDGGRFGVVNAEVVYSRHRPWHAVGGLTKPAGVTHIAYVDGHVEAKRHDELADFTTGKSRLDSLWSPLDAEQDN